jgi:hypothetical protein
VARYAELAAGGQGFVDDFGGYVDVAGSVRQTVCSKGVDDSKKALDGFKKSLGGIASTAKNMFNFDVLNKAKASLETLTKGSLDVYKANQQAADTLTATTQKNAKLGKDSLKNITDYTNKLSEASELLFSGSELQWQAAFLTNLSLTEEQIKTP